jgi:phosphatidylinositol-3-phosphatase
MGKLKWILTFISVIVIAFIFVIIIKANHQDQSVKPHQKAVKSNHGLPMPKHIVIVVGENHSYDQIIGDPNAPYINSLAKRGILFTNSHGIAHPSQPNYLALFSGDTQGVSNDSCPHSFSSDNLAVELKKSGRSFAGYSEDLPSVGFTGCRHNAYHRKHNPWVNFTNVPPENNMPFASFPDNYSKLPTVSFVIPNLDHDMHDGTVEEADTWLRENLDKYIQWAYSNDSLFILTWDEDNFRKPNQIPTIFVGPMIKSGKYDKYIDHYTVLRTIEDMYALPPLGNTRSIPAISDIWR